MTRSHRHAKVACAEFYIDYCIDEVRAIVNIVEDAIPTVADVKASAGWGGPTTFEHVRVVSNPVQGAVAVKAAGGIRTIEGANSIVERGVTRFGGNDRVAVALVNRLRGEVA
jgi:deoxyribose-phosphate aldolase